MHTLDDSAWDAKLSQLDGSFLQSSAWGAFQEASGLKTHRLHGEGWACLLVEQRSKARSYLFAPYGPAFESPAALSEALQTIAGLGKELGFDWVRVEPGLGVRVDTDLSELLERPPLRILRAHKQIDPLYTRLLDLTPDTEAILASISSSTRSLIRKNLREQQVEFKTSTDPADITYFLDMIHTVSKRNQVFFHSDEHFRKEAEVLMPLGCMRLEFALLGGKPIACIVMHDFNRTSNYTYAATLPEAREVNASALLLWQAITNAKHAGMATLDLFGTLPEDGQLSHPWYGFSTFKRKFGGRVVRRGQTLDIPLRPARYRAYRLVVKAKRRLR